MKKKTQQKNIIYSIKIETKIKLKLKHRDFVKIIFINFNLFCILNNNNKKNMNEMNNKVYTYIP